MAIRSPALIGELLEMDIGDAVQEIADRLMKAEDSRLAAALRFPHGEEADED